jgi:hypothetical protein
MCDNDERCKKVVWTVTPEHFTTYSLSASRPRDPTRSKDEILAALDADAAGNKGQDEDSKCKETTCHCAENGAPPTVTTDSYVAETLWSEQVIIHEPGKPDRTEWYAYGATAPYTLTKTETLRSCMPNHGHVDGGTKHAGRGQDVYVRTIRPGSGLNELAIEVFGSGTASQKG